MEELRERIEKLESDQIEGGCRCVALTIQCPPSSATCIAVATCTSRWPVMHMQIIEDVSMRE